MTHSYSAADTSHVVTPADRWMDGWMDGLLPLSVILKAAARTPLCEIARARDIYTSQNRAELTTRRGNENCVGEKAVEVGVVLGAPPIRQSHS